ncbi:hypothetical protein NJI34_34690 [Pseudomonas sp. S 311-6]|nr:hypothetical protein [Pseudomonas sp. S 311-6]
MSIDTKKLRELEAKATAGPWHTKTECPGRCCWHIFKDMPMYGDNDDHPIVMDECSEDDAAFMTEIRNAATELLNLLDAQAAEIESLRRVLHDLVSGAGAEMAPGWICNSYHPKLVKALDKARAALSGEGK